MVPSTPKKLKRQGVKLKGGRVEFGEIESTRCSCPQNRAADFKHICSVAAAGPVCSAPEVKGVDGRGRGGRGLRCPLRRAPRRIRAGAPLLPPRSEPPPWHHRAATSPLFSRAPASRPARPLSTRRHHVRRQVQDAREALPQRALQRSPVRAHARGRGGGTVPLDAVLTPSTRTGHKGSILIACKVSRSSASEASAAIKPRVDVIPASPPRILPAVQSCGTQLQHGAATLDGAAHAGGWTG